MPSSVVLPPVEFCRGTRPSQAARSRALRNCRPSPIAASSAVAAERPDAGDRHQPSGAIIAGGKRFNLRVTTAIRGSTAELVEEFAAAGARIAGVRSLVSSARCARGRAGRRPAPWRIATPYSRQKARIWLISRVRFATSWSRMRWSACRSTCSVVRPRRSASSDASRLRRSPQHRWCRSFAT